MSEYYIKNARIKLKDNNQLNTINNIFELLVKFLFHENLFIVLTIKFLKESIY